ncbi:MAG: TRAP transporter TatT component family protein [Gammaproteobacteria bacterium]
MSRENPRRYVVSGLRVSAALALVIMLSGCGALISRATDSAADALSQAILNQNDPATVRDAAPAYLVLLDAMVRNDPKSPGSLSAASTLYAAYGVAFVDEADRAKRLTSRARDYGQRAVCAYDENNCALGDASFDEFDERMSALEARDAPVFYAYAVSWLAYMRAHSDDWAVLADLPKVEAVLSALNGLDTDYERGNINLYLGVLNTLRPPALGGKPEEGRAYFERAIALSDGRDLSAKVEFARSYARLLYDRELHDKLLGEVLSASPEAEGLTLFNVMAQSQAEELLASADDYF